METLKQLEELRAQMADLKAQSEAIKQQRKALKVKIDVFKLAAKMGIKPDDVIKAIANKLVPETATAADGD